MSPPADVVPRIDVSALLDSSETPERRRAQARIREACSEIGFMTVAGHGIERSCIDAALSAARHFFALPEASKLAVSSQRFRADSPNRYRGYFPASAAGKEGLDVGEPRLRDPALLARPYHERNLFPPGLDEEWRSAIEGYFDALSGLARLVLRALVAALGGDPERVDAGFARPASLSTLRFNFYPRLEEPVCVGRDDAAALSCEDHVDSGLLTLLYQDENDAREGLQVFGSDGQWHSLEPDPAAFVVNTGLALQRMTGGALVATRHRVLYSRRERLSVPFFLEPVPDFRMRAESLGLPHASRGRDESYEEFLRRSLERFAEYQA